MNHYDVIITLMLKEAADSIISSLAKKGYLVGPLADDLITTSDDNAAAVLGLRLIGREELTLPKVYEHVIEVVKDVGFRYYSIVITASGTWMTWNVGNVRVGKHEKPKKNIEPKQSIGPFKEKKKDEVIKLSDYRKDDS